MKNLMKHLSYDIVIKICDYLDSYSIRNLLITSRHYYWIWKEMGGRIALNNKQLDRAIRDPNCQVICLIYNFATTNDYTKEDKVPERHLTIVGANNCLCFKMTSKLGMRIHFRKLTPYIIKIDAPEWDIQMTDVQLEPSFASTQIKCRNLHIDNLVFPKSSSIGNVHIRAKHLQMVNVNAFAAGLLKWILICDQLYLRNYNGNCANMAIVSNTVDISGSEFNKELTHCIYLQKVESASITDCIFRSSYSSSPYPNPVLLINSTGQLKFERNRLVSSDGRFFENENDLIIFT